MSQSWFYKWRDGALPPRAARRERLKAEVARLFAEREGKDGSPRVTAALRDAGWRVSENTVAGLMREQGLAARRNKRRKATTRPGRGRWRAPDQVRRKFAVSGINRRWYGDGTEVVTGEGKLYLDSVPGASMPVARRCHSPRSLASPRSAEAPSGLTASSAGGNQATARGHLGYPCIRGRQPTVPGRQRQRRIYQQEPFTSRFH